MSISRRSILKGLGGAFVALPALEIMSRGVRASNLSIPCRYLVAFGGMSIGRDGQELISPAQTGAGYTPTVPLQPLTTHGVVGDVSVISGLLIPSVPIDAQPTRPGERNNPFHGYCHGPTLCGVRTAGGQVFRGPTSDQVVADVIGGDTPLRNMTLRVQATGYGDDSPEQGVISYRQSGSQVERVNPTVHPSAIYEQLFGLAAGSISPFDRDRRVSVLDLVKERAAALNTRLGQTDRTRMEQHFDHISDLETRLRAIDLDMPPEELTCSVNPQLGQTIEINEDASYSNEDLRAELICDMIALAFACDISRVGSLQFTYAQCGMDAGPISSVSSKSIHACSHDANSDGALTVAMREVLSWHIGHFARLTRRLADTQEIDGSRLLDHCALSLVFEGGMGTDTVHADNPRPDSPHSTENMVALIAGGAGGMQHGQHIRATNLHPASVLGTAMQAVGVPGGLGEITATIPELF